MTEQAEDEGMCPNCVTPWKCNGPHLSTDGQWRPLRYPEILPLSWLGTRVAYTRGEWLAWVAAFILAGLICGYGFGSLR